MLRRGFLNSGLATAFADRPRRPNVVVVMSDEQRWDTIGADGCPWMITPHLDRLAREGVLFGNAYCPSPVCVASRASFHNGLYPPATGVYTNTYRWDGSKEWMWSFRQNGYYCASFGKNHYVPYESSACAWNERVIAENKNGDGKFKDDWDRFLEPRGIPRPPKRFERIGRKAFREQFGAHTWEWAPEAHSDFFIGDRAVDWIQNYNRREPFLLWVGFPGPHTPIDPVKKYVDLYASKNPPGAVGGREELERKPWEQRQQFEYWHLDNNDDGIWLSDATPEKTARLRRHYYANITMIDEKVGGILAALEKKRILDNTIIVFTSDHGNMLVDHALFVKWSAYDGSVRVPLLVWYPSAFPGGRRTMRLTQTFDVVPALLAEAQCPLPAGRQWHSCARFLRNRSDPEPERRFVYSMVERDRGVWSKRCPSTFVMIRAREHKFVWYENSSSRELYDVRRDPNELENLAGRPQLAGLQSEFEKETVRWLSGGNS